MDVAAGVAVVCLGVFTGTAGVESDVDAGEGFLLVRASSVAQALSKNKNKGKTRAPDDREYIIVDPP
jgi:hypothetical protein